MHLFSGILIVRVLVHFEGPANNYSDYVPFWALWPIVMFAGACVVVAKGVKWLVEYKNTPKSGI